MEARFQRIVEQLERKKGTHPHLAHLWQSYMKIKKQRFLQYCSCCENIIDRLSEEPDMDPNTILTIFILMTHCTTDLNRIY